MARRKERRRRRRIDVALPVRIEYNNEQFVTQTKNISVLGAYIEAAKQFPPGAGLNLKIAIPLNEVSCQGAVFRCQPMNLPSGQEQYGIGIFFRGFSAGSEQVLADYIDDTLLEERKLGKIYQFQKKHVH